MKKLTRTPRQKRAHKRLQAKNLRARTLDKETKRRVNYYKNSQSTRVEREIEMAVNKYARKRMELWREADAASLRASMAGVKRDE